MGKNILKDNRGLTLVEMLVSFAILSLIMVALFQFMNQMMKQYQTSNNEIIVQNEAQTLVQQLENLIIDADMGVETYDSTGGGNNYTWLYIMSSDGFYVIVYVPSTSSNADLNSLYFEEYSGIWDEDSGITKDNVFETAKAYREANGTTSDLLAENVTTFKVTDTSKTLTTTSNYVAIEITISKLSRSYTVNKNIYLRNQIVPSVTATPTPSVSASPTPSS